MTTSGFITSMCIVPSAVDSTYNNILLGTSTGNLYRYSPVSGSTKVNINIGGISNSNQITGLATDNGGLYTYVGIPGANALCRYSTSDVLSNTTIDTTTGTNSNIYTVGDNTGGIVVDSLGYIYFIAQSGISILYMGNYGFETSTTTLYSNTNPLYIPSFYGLAFEAGQTRLFVTDINNGTLSYYDFIKDTGELSIYYQAPLDQKYLSVYFDNNNNPVIGMGLLGSSIIRMRLIDSGLVTDVAGGGTDLNAREPTDRLILNTRAVLADTVNNIYFTTDISGSTSSALVNLSFSFIDRVGVSNYPPRQGFANCGLPEPGNCKRGPPNFSPREFWGWGSPNRKFLTPDPNLGCLLTPYVACATILRAPPPPPVPPPVVVPVVPVIPTEHPTTQFSDPRVSLATIASDATFSISYVVVSNCGLITGAPALSPVGDLYVAGSAGIVFKYNTSSDTVPLPRFSWSNNMGFGPVVQPISVSTQGLVGVVAGSTLAMLDPSTGALRWSNTLPFTPVGSPAFLNNTMFVAGSNMVTSVDSNGNVLWLITAAGNGELFTTSPYITGSSVYVGTSSGRMYSLSSSGNIRWVYDTLNGISVQSTPSLVTQGSRVVFGAGSNLFAINSQNPRSSNFDVIVDYSNVTDILSSPAVFIDNVTGGVGIRSLFVGNNCNAVMTEIYGSAIKNILSTTTNRYTPTSSPAMSIYPFYAYLTVSSGEVDQLDMSLNIHNTFDLSHSAFYSSTAIITATRRVYVAGNQKTNLCNGTLSVIY
jgi:hypothetical protein